MKTFTSLSLSIILFSGSINTYAAEYKFIAGDNKMTTQICMAAVTDNTKVLISHLRKLSQRGTALSFRSFVNTIECNDQFIANFAKIYHAENAFSYLDRYTNKRNKNRQANITIKDIAKKKTLDKTDTLIVLVRSQ
jgi:hypothetical protein